MADLVSEGPDAGRLVGWKAIAFYLNVSQSTAIRWAERYGLPVTRVRRGDRPLVYANHVDLDIWWQSASAAAVRDHDATKECREAPGPLPDRTAGAPAAEVQVRGGVDIRQLWSALRRYGGLRVFALLGCLLAVAGGFVVWRARAVDSRSAGSLPATPVQRAHSGAAAPALIELRAAPAGQVWFSITVAEGEMARLETPNLNLGLQGKMVGGQLKAFVYRLMPVGTGESAEFLESRLLSPGDSVQSVRVNGSVFELIWPGEIPSAVTAARLPRSQCCMVCAGLTACGRNVSATCGGCQGEVKLTGAER